METAFKTFSFVYLHILFLFVFIFLFCFLAVPHGIWDPSSLTRNGTVAPLPPPVPRPLAVEVWSLNYWTAREVPWFHFIERSFFFFLFSWMNLWFCNGALMVNLWENGIRVSLLKSLSFLCLSASRNFMTKQISKRMWTLSLDVLKSWCFKIILKKNPMLGIYFVGFQLS